MWTPQLNWYEYLKAFHCQTNWQWLRFVHYVGFQTFQKEKVGNDSRRILCRCDVDQPYKPSVFVKIYFWNCIFESVFLKVYFQDVYCVGILGRAPETQSKQRSETATDTLSFPGRVELSKIENLLFQRDGEYIFFSVRKRRVHVESPRGINWLAAPSLTKSHKYTNTNTKYTLKAPEV